MAGRRPISPSKHSSSKGVQTIHRAITLLRLVSENNNEGIRFPELVRRAGLQEATTRRILKALEAHELISCDPKSRLYYLGINLYYLGATARQFHLRERFRYILERIAEKTGDTVFLVIRSGYDSLIIDRVEGTFHIKALPQEIGQRVPLGIGSGSTTLLASLPEEESNSVIRLNAKRYGQYNNRTVEDVRAEVIQCRKNGYAVSEGNIIPGTAGVGLPVLDPEGNAVAAVSVSAIAERLEQNRRQEIAGWIEDEIASIVWLPDNSKRR